MLNINKLLILIIVSMPNILYAHDSHNFKQCIKVYEGSTFNAPVCYQEEADRYKKLSDKIFWTLYSSIPKKDKKLLADFKNSIKQQLKVCELKYQAYYLWGKDKIYTTTLADHYKAECYYEIRKQEYLNIRDLVCIPDDSCNK